MWLAGWLGNSLLPRGGWHHGHTALRKRQRAQLGGCLLRSGFGLTHVRS